MKCPKVKQFRADLTKFLLSPATHANPQYNDVDFTCTNFPPMNPAQIPSIYNKNINKNNHNNYYHYDGVHRTPLSNPHHWSSNTCTTSSIVNKIDDLINRMNQVNVMLEKIVNKNDQFEQFIKDKTINDEIVSNKIDDLIKNENNIKLITAQHEIKITRHKNLFMKLVIPILDEASSFLSNINLGKHSETLDADFKVTINRLRA